MSNPNKGSSSSSLKAGRGEESGGSGHANKRKQQSVDEIRPSTDAMVDEDDEVEMGEFEDPYEDEYESDGEVVDGMDEDDDEDGEGKGAASGMQAMDLEDKDEDDVVKPFIPGRDHLAEGEELEHDSTAYELLHNLEVEWPCLSFDVLHDGLGQQRITVRKKKFFFINN